jgi:hypothetical protein
MAAGGNANRGPGRDVVERARQSDEQLVAPEALAAPGGEQNSDYPHSMLDLQVLAWRFR